MTQIKRFIVIAAVLIAAALNSGPALAHFQVIIPSQDVVEKNQTIELNVAFIHPFEGPSMDMARPVQFGVAVKGRKKNLLASLKPYQLKGHQAFKATFDIKRAGDHIFYVEPKPYWEPAEDCFIVHNTKVVVNAKGLEVGWDQPVGLKAEIVPLTRPYGLWAGNVFQGRVLMDGKAVPFAEVEIEYLADGKIKPPAGVFVTQVIKADANGVFTYAMPKAGWWGFAALMEAPDKIKGPDGTPKPVELGAVIWVKTWDLQ